MDIVYRGRNDRGVYRWYREVGQSETENLRVGTVVDVIALPAVSATVPIAKLDTVRSAEFSPAPTVYVPVSVVPAEAAVKSTVAPVSSVTVSVFPD